MNKDNEIKLRVTGEAESFLDIKHGKPIAVFGTENIRATFDQETLTQAMNARLAPGVTGVVLGPDAHRGYGAPIGCVMSSDSHIYPAPVGYDVKCSMSLLQLDLGAEAIDSPNVRRRLIHAICQRIPTGMGKGQRNVPNGRKISLSHATRAVTEGASDADLLGDLGIPVAWAKRCEDSFHKGHDGSMDSLRERMFYHSQVSFANDKKKLGAKLSQLGSYGSGNHFGECEIVRVREDKLELATRFGLKDGKVAFLSHCGSRGFGHVLAGWQLKTLQKKFSKWGIPLPSGEKELVYAPLGTPEANEYIDDMSLGANFATINHLLINALVLEAFRAVFPGIGGELVYFISHNIARRELVDGKMQWVHRKGATRAFPARHHALRDTPFFDTGHPILLPGDPVSGSSVMVAAEGASKSCYSVNHGAGRLMGRMRAKRELDQANVDLSLSENDVMTNCRHYPKDESPAAYKDFGEVLRSVEVAGLASEVARLVARFVIKDADDDRRGR